MVTNAPISLTHVAFIAGGLLVVAARLHEYTFRPLTTDPRWERRLYWFCSVVGSVVATAAMIPHGLLGVLPIGFITVWSTLLHRPGVPNQRRRWER